MYDDHQHRADCHAADDVRRAIDSLTVADLGRLKTAARALFGGFSLDAVARGADDLVSEAVMRTVEGSRRWRIGMDLLPHLIEVMRSIAESWKKSAERQATATGELRESDLIGAEFETEADDDEDASPVQSAPSWEPGALRLLLGKEQLEPFLDHFADDLEASAVLDGWWWQMTGPEIQQRSSLSKHGYQAAVLRIRRYAQTKGTSHGDQ